MKTLIAFVLTLSMALVAVTCSAGEPVKRADAAYGVSYVQEQVIQLPQDQGKFYLTVFGNEGEYRFEQVKSWVANDPQLHALKAQTTYNIYRADSVMFRERYAQGVSNIPCVRLIDTQTGRMVGDTRNTTEIYSAAFLKPDETNGFDFARSSISGFLLCGLAIEPPWVAGALHPNPTNRFDPAVLPSIGFCELEIDKAKGALSTKWSRNPKRSQT